MNFMPMQRCDARCEPPDGSTLLVAFTCHTINATLYPKLPYDPVTDFMPISMIATVPFAAPRAGRLGRAGGRP